MKIRRSDLPRNAASILRILHQILGTGDVLLSRGISPYSNYIEYLSIFLFFFVQIHAPILLKISKTFGDNNSYQFSVKFETIESDFLCLIVLLTLSLFSTTKLYFCLQNVDRKMTEKKKNGERSLFSRHRRVQRCSGDVADRCAGRMPVQNPLSCPPEPVTNLLSPVIKIVQNLIFTDRVTEWRQGHCRLTPSCYYHFHYICTAGQRSVVEPLLLLLLLQLRQITIRLFTSFPKKIKKARSVPSSSPMICFPPVSYPKQEIVGDPHDFRFTRTR